MSGALPVRIAHCAYALPERIESNEELARQNPAWNFDDIVPKTGVRSRHVAGPATCASDLAHDAAAKLFREGDVDPADVDTLLYCTQSPDYFLPTTACLLQNRLGLPITSKAFDFNLGCSGFIYGLATAGAYIASGIARKVLLLCADTYTRYIRPDDRTARTVFGDGAAAVLLEPASNGESIGPFVFGTDGRGYDKIIVRGGGMRHAAEPATLSLHGPAVFMFTKERIPACVRELLQKGECEMSAVDLFVFHQASKLVLDELQRTLEIPPGKVVRNYELIGNTVSASIPIALCDAFAAGTAARGQRVAFVGFGVGLSWGACLARL